MKTCKSYERAGKELDGDTASLEAKFGTLFRDIEAEARGFAWRLTGNSDEASELVQEAARRALKRFEDYDPVRSFQSWYLTIVRNVFLDLRRGMRRMLCLDLPAGGDDDRSLVEVLPDGSMGVFEQLEREEVAEAVAAAIGNLTPKYRAVVQLCDMQGMSYDEAARRLGVPTGTVRSRLWRARAALRRDEKVRRLA
ncbi:MAG: RNA polymerase sigma factor [Elusimicrobia bacterium]|nr:RNA polymerase sigma factor [Elusimicrobiota bacterium]MDE2424428.1 RNA polymerase sigma factor [Elusimicrobiota bacterium]